MSVLASAWTPCSSRIEIVTRLVENSGGASIGWTLMPPGMPTLVSSVPVTNVRWVDPSRKVAPRMVTTTTLC